MKITCKSEDLVNTLNVLSPAMAPSTITPAQGGVVLHINEGGITAAANDRNLGIETNLPGVVEGEGKVILHGKTLSGIAKTLGGGEVVIAEGDGQTRLTCNRAVFNLNNLLPGLPSPIWPREFDTTVKMDAKPFLDVISRVAFSSARENSRPVLTGVCFNSQLSGLDVVAIDGVRLAKCCLPAVGPAGQWVIPADALRAVSRILSKEPSVMIGLGETAACLQAGRTKLFTSLLNSVYPDYEKIVPRAADLSTSLECDKVELLDAIARVSVASDTTKDAGICLGMNPGRVSLKAKSETAEGSEELAGELTGPAQRIMYNAQYLLDACRAASGAKIRLATDGRGRPLLVRGEGENWCAVLMPLNVLDTQEESQAAA